MLRSHLQYGFEQDRSWSSGHTSEVIKRVLQEKPDLIGLSSRVCPQASRMEGLNEGPIEVHGIKKGEIDLRLRNR